MIASKDQPKPILVVDSVSKRYQLGSMRDEAVQVTLRDVLSNGVRTISNKLLGKTSHHVSPPDGCDQSFWALKDVSFSLKHGEIVGVIGDNGAGKSTMLKVISRITDPTSGRVILRGRVASLLEVGTGFHPELTGRENIFLNGAILGMTRREVFRKFDQIVQFAGVERFVDTPVKRYSSGMYVRLAFAVAAHLEPEILIIDEVLAVGDAQFQRRCLGKMKDVAQSGRTILFVSHNMSAVNNLCERVVRLKDGAMIDDGPAGDVVRRYLSEQVGNPIDLSQSIGRGGSGVARLRSVSIHSVTTGRLNQVSSGDDLEIHLSLEVNSGVELLGVVVSLALKDEDGNFAWLVRSNFEDEWFDLKDHAEIVCRIQNFNLAEGRYQLVVFISHRENEVLDHVENAFDFIVAGGDFFGTGSAGLPTHCKTLTRSKWFAH